VSAIAIAKIKVRILRSNQILNNRTRCILSVIYAVFLPL
jgi:hypothetical protein